MYVCVLCVLCSFLMCVFFGAGLLAAFPEQCGNTAETWARARENEDIYHSSFKRCGDKISKTK